jgi:hypothetical protein
VQLFALVARFVFFVFCFYIHVIQVQLYARYIYLTIEGAIARMMVCTCSFVTCKLITGCTTVVVHLYNTELLLKFYIILLFLRFLRLRPRISQHTTSHTLSGFTRLVNFEFLSLHPCHLFHPAVPVPVVLSFVVAAVVF